ncbi:MAG: di-trans,poly-cis-decaprenylcistransferase [Chloroflexi bacterium]|nr:di-trans,poly-cis-decaprenylcistransferase [Chloroflexota bacterium]
MTETNETPELHPQHVAIIMDGNGRWARARGLPRLMGHRAGTENIRRIVHACVENGVKYLTVYAFSTENWTRPSNEVQGLMRILAEVIERETPELKREGVQIRHFGHMENVPLALQKAIKYALDTTKENDRLVLSVCFNYGGRDDIVRAIRKIVASGAESEDITDELISRNLDTADIPDPDLIIRTAGEMRLSNFLLWQAAYAEYYSTPTTWPDFGKEAFHEALVEYGRRQRKFGGILPEERQEYKEENSTPTVSELSEPDQPGSSTPPRPDPAAVQ